MNKTFKIIALTTAISVNVVSNAYAEEASANDRAFYIGGEFGISDPVVKSFKHEDKEEKKKTNIRLKKSRIYTARVGYGFYPNMMLEFSATHQPKYNVAYVLPAFDFPAGPITLPIAAAHERTKMTTKVYMLNLIYELEKMRGGITPFVIFGAGIAQVHIKPKSTYYDIRIPGGPVYANQELFRVKSSKSNCFAWQAGVGVSKEIANNLSVDVAAKLQVIHNLKLKYDKIQRSTGTLGAAEPIKKTIGVGEFSVGFTYKLPI